MKPSGRRRLRAAAVYSAAAAAIVLGATAPAQEIRTPAPAPAPRVNGPTVFGVRPGSAFLYKIPATGTGTITYSVSGLPSGLSVNSATGLITGTVASAGNYNVTLSATNSLGASNKNFTIKVGNTIGLTPALGWNSWNVWGGSVTAAKVKAAADSFVSFGLINHGWSYVNTDDYWQGARGGTYNGIQANSNFLGSTFADMGAQVNYIHGLGLKAGIYSTPWIQSYGGFIGGSANNPQGTWVKVNDNSQKVDGIYSFATNDANQWAAWGVDYLKYDWNPHSPTVVSNAQFHTETATMQQALGATSRDILYSYSNSMPFDQIPDQGPMLNSWRISGDITDSWSSMSGKGFGQDRWAPYATPGHFNDPDMLEVGWVGKSANPHPTNLTPDEQYTHLTIWSLLSAPLLLGCDLSRLDAFTLNLISNDEVLAVDQDALGKQALRKTNITTPSGNNIQVYLKDLEDGTQAVGLFNLGTTSDTVTADWADLGISGVRAVRDLWRQTDLGQFDQQFSLTIAPHGAELIKLSLPSVAAQQMWNGAADQTSWNFSAANFNENSANVPFANGKSVAFTDSAPASATSINISATVSPAAVNINSAARNYTFSGTGAITGTGSLTKSGNSTLTILNANSYTGTTTISGGTITVGGTAGALGSGNIINNAALVYARSNTAVVTNSISGSGNLTQSGAGTLILTGTNTYSGTTTIDPTRTLQIGSGGATGSLGTGAVANSGTLAFNRSGAATVGGIISGSGALVQNGAGTVVLGAANTYTGTTTINSGIVTVTNASGTTSSLGAVPGGDVTINSGGILNLGGGIAASNALNSFGQKLFHISGTGGGLGAITNRNYVTDPSGNTGANQQLNGLLRVILDADAMVAAPSLGFDGAYSGGNVLGRFDIRGTNSAGVNSAQLNLNGHNLTKSANSFLDLVNCDVTGTGNIIVSATAGNTLCLESNTKILDDGGASRILIGDGAMLEFWAQSSSGGTNLTRRVEMGDGTPGSVAYLSQGGGSSNTSAMPILLKSNLVVRPTYANQNNTSLTIAASISQDAIPRKIIKTNVGTLTLAGNNTFTGGLDINVGSAPVNGTGFTGMIVLASGGAISPANVVSFDVAATYTGTLRLSGNSASIAGLRTVGTAGTEIVENFSSTPATLTVNNAASHTFAGAIQDGIGTGKLSLTKSGPSILVLNGTNTYTGDTTIAGGTLVALTAASLGAPANQLLLSGNGTLRTDGAFTSARKIQINAGASGVINSNGFDSTWDDLTGGGNLTKNGLGKLTVRSIQAGNLIVNAGVLSVKDRATTGGNLAARMTTLSLAASAALDLKDNDLVVNSGNFTAIKSLILTGFGNPAAGITSSTSDGSQILALFDNALVGAGSWDGATIAPNAIVGKYTFFGDVNFDGQVTGDDYTIIDSNLNTTPPVGFEWLSGDANLDGIVTGDDYTTIDSNLGLGAGNPLASSALTASPLPEPGVLGLGAAGLLLARLRLRCKRGL